MYQLTDLEMNDVAGGASPIDPPLVTPIDPPLAG